MAARHDVVGVVTQPDRPAGRGLKLVATPVKRAAEARGLRVLMPEKLKPFADEARALGADAFVVASYGKIVPQALLDAVPVAFNVHPSLLPLYRGATPLQSAIRDGRTETAVSIIAMDAGMDTGDVLLQERTPIGPAETYGELHDRLARRGAELVVAALDEHARGTLARVPQAQLARELGIADDEIARTLTRPLRKDDLEIDWSDAPRKLVDVVRSLNPTPLARATIGMPPDAGDLVVKIVEARVARPFESANEPTYDGGIVILCGADPATGDSALVIRSLIPPNRGRMMGADFGRAHKLFETTQR